MPTNTLIRTWCKTCNDWKLHSTNYICQSCETEFTTINTSDIPEAKVLEQRERYKQSRQRSFSKILNPYITNDLNYLALANDSQTQIVEEDAGQKDMDEQRSRLRQKAIDERNALKQEYETNYKHLQRNDMCSCGSGKKYKKCCQSKFQSI